MKSAQLKELVLQALETELGGVKLYRTAITCVVNSDLKKEWEEYLEQTEHHVEVLENLCDRLAINTEEQSPGRAVVKDIGAALVQAMKDALDAGKDAAQLVACECIVLAETKDHLNWELLGQAAKSAKADEAKALKAAYDEVEDEEDEHLYHTQGWCRELWIQSLGMKAAIPPPEEEKDVKTAIGAARAKQARLK